MNKVLVTGASGFLGQAVVAELERWGMTAFRFDKRDGYDVLDREQVAACVASSGAEAVIHLAGVLGTSELFEHVPYAIDVNVKGTANVLEACRATQARYVGVTLPDVFPSVYTATKVAATRLATAYHHAYGVPVSHVRAYNAYGPGQAYGDGHPRKIIPTFAVAAWRGEPIEVWGDGEQYVDLVHVDDLARMFVDALGYGDDDVFDGGTGYPRTVNEVAALVREVAQSTSPIVHLPMRLGERPTRICASRGEGWDRLGWSPEPVSVSRLGETVMAYRPSADAERVA